MSTDAVTFDVRDGVAILTLNESRRMNPLTPAVQTGVLDGLERVREDKAIRVLVVTARGRGFCVGADLADLGKRANDESSAQTLGQIVGRMMTEGGNPIVAGLRSLPVPVVCAINGVAAGGGVGLALAGDMVIAARSAYFYLPFVPALGIVPDMGSTWSLLRSIGRARAIGLALTGHKLSGEKAAQWGLIWDCVDDEQLQPRALQLAQKLANLPVHVIVEVRAIFAAAEMNSFEDQLAVERDRQQVLIDGESFHEGLAAFAAKRTPVFKGRRES